MFDCNPEFVRRGSGDNNRFPIELATGQLLSLLRHRQMVIRLIHLEAHIHVGHLRHLGVAALLGVRRVHTCTVDPLCHPVILAALQMLAIDVTIVLCSHWEIINTLIVSC